MSTSIAKGFDPSKIRWKNVKHFSIQSVFWDDGTIACFTPYIVYRTGSTRRIGHRCSIADARSICASLGARYDVPVQDWTRPAPPTLELGTSFPPSHNSGEEPVWAYGWQYSDRFFRDGCTQDRWEHCIKELMQIIYRAHLCDGLPDDQARENVRRAGVAARNRWLVLLAANSSTENVR